MSRNGYEAGGLISPPADVAAVLGVIVRWREKGRARETSEGWRFKFEATDLRGADLKGGHFERALLGERI